MAKRRRKQSSKCPEPFNTLINLAGGAVMNTIADKMEEKHHYRKRGVPNPYRASAFGISTGRLRNTNDLIRLGGFLGAMGSFDPDDSDDGIYSDNYHNTSILNSHTFIDIPWEYDNITPNISVKNNNKYAWRMNCDDGSEYGILPENYETRDEYNSALKKVKEKTFSESEQPDLNNTVEKADSKSIKFTDGLFLCRVSLLDKGKNKYYKTENEMIKVGDKVLVPSKDDTAEYGIVISVEKITPDAEANIESIIE